VTAFVGSITKESKTGRKAVYVEGPMMFRVHFLRSSEKGNVIIIIIIIIIIITLLPCQIGDT